MSDWFAPIAGIATMAFGLAALAVILSRQAATADVIGAGSKGLGAIISAAVAPVATISTTTGGIGGT